MRLSHIRRFILRYRLFTVYSEIKASLAVDNESIKRVKVGGKGSNIREVTVEI